MPRIQAEEIAEIKKRADIVDVISHYINVQKQGRDYVALCPFHDDHNPSMRIYQDRQSYKCWACNNGGDVFEFVKNKNNITFPEAVQEVAEVIGYELSDTSPTYEKPKDPRIASLEKIMKEAVSFHSYQLQLEEAKPIVQYLSRRGIDEKMIAYFNIGYNPKDDSLTRFLEAKGYAQADLIACNLARVDAHGVQDVFHDRITFPIHDMYGNPIGFTARSIATDVQAKYINTNQTELFTKGNIVYNYHRARNKARSEKKVYVCEGVTDVMAFHKAGYDNAVATLGTACTQNQIQLLKNLAPTVVLCYDGDNAGQTAIYKNGKLIVHNGCRITVVKNETGLDPDEIVQKHGVERLQQVISQEIDWLEFVIDYFKKRMNLNSYLEKKEFAKKVFAEFDILSDEMDRHYYSEKVKELTGIAYEEVEQSQPKQKRKPERKANVLPSGLEEAEDMMLVMMTKSPKAIQMFEEKLGYMSDSNRHVLAMMLVDQYHSKGKIDLDVLKYEAEEESIRQEIARLQFDEKFNIDFDENVMDGAIRKIKIETLQKEADAYQNQLNEIQDPEIQKGILKVYQECLMHLRRYIDEEDNKN